MFKSVDLNTLKSTWNEVRADKENRLAMYSHEGWTEFVEAYCAPDSFGEQVNPGVFVTWTFNFGHLYLTEEYDDCLPERNLAKKDGVEELIWMQQNNWQTFSYGVCDSVGQFLASETYRFYNERPEECVARLVEIRKADQPKRDGWRWHKWGPYIGTHEIQCEYLADEEGIS
jgi:hypothetical protein